MPRILALALLLLLGAAPVLGQTQPPPRVTRTYVPPEQIVSFSSATPLDRFLAVMEPLFERVYGKGLIDPEGRTQPIGVPVSGLHFFDAFNYVLSQHQLTFRENDRYFVVADPAPMATSSVPGQLVSAVQPGQGRAPADPLVSLATREIQINALLFEVNLNRARDLGVDWSALFGTSSTGEAAASDIALNTRRLFDQFGGTITGPDQITFTTLTQLFRAFETEGVGQTIARPQITVRSGETGRIQIGSDVPVQTRDFAGNTVTQFFSTGIIVDVKPTFHVERTGVAEDSPLLDYLHLVVDVEKSGARPSTSGAPSIDRNKVSTQVLLLDGEQTVIGGLYTTEETTSRRGIPVLKDLPGWFFGLRYVFGYEQRIQSRKELLIVLHARVLDGLQERVNRQPGDFRELQRRAYEEHIRVVGEAPPSRP